MVNVRNSKLIAWIVLALSFSIAGTSHGAPPKAGDDDASDVSSADDKTDAQSEEEALEKLVKSYEVPKGSSQELLKFIDRIRRFEPKSLKQFMVHAKFGQRAIKTAAERILAQEKDSASPAARKAADYVMASRVQMVDEATSAEQQALIDEIHQRLIASHLSEDNLALAEVLTSNLEEAGKSELAIAAYNNFAKDLSTGNATARILRERFMGSARRLALPGNPVKLEGTTLAGKKFDWSAYRGKVVLLDFWATWCGPCRAELPNVKAVYEKYHDAGFEVVGISIDDDREVVANYVKKEDVPWTMLLDLDSAGDHPLANYYGLTGVPTMWLIGRDGKLISLSARGDELKQLLAHELSSPQKRGN